MFIWIKPQRIQCATLLIYTCKVSVLKPGKIKKGGPSKWTTRERRSEWSTMTYLLWGNLDKSKSPLCRTIRTRKVTNYCQNFKPKGQLQSLAELPLTRGHPTSKCSPPRLPTMNYSYNKHRLIISQGVNRFFNRNWIDECAPIKWFQNRNHL